VLWPASQRLGAEWEFLAADVVRHHEERHGVIHLLTAYIDK